MAYALAAHALSKRYGDNWALTAIDLQVPFGGITALIGPNGAGKSTLMRLWLAFERPTSGAAYVNGIDSCADPLHPTCTDLGMYDRVPMLRAPSHLSRVGGLRGAAGLQRRRAERHCDAALEADSGSE